MQAFYMTENKQDASPFLLTNESQILEVTPFIIFFFSYLGTTNYRRALNLTCSFMNN